MIFFSFIFSFFFFLSLRYIYINTYMYSGYVLLSYISKYSNIGFKMQLYSVFFFLDKNELVISINTYHIVVVVWIYNTKYVSSSYITS